MENKVAVLFRRRFFYFFRNMAKRKKRTNEETPIKRIFVDYMTTPSTIQGLMEKEGYSDYSAKSCTVTHTKEWKDLMETYYPDRRIMKLMKDIEENGDASTKLGLLKELNKLKDKYPDKKIRVGAMEERDDTTKTKPLF